MRGQVRMYNGAKGYAFLVLDDASDSFIHISSLPPEHRDKLRVGSVVEGEVEQAMKGPAMINAKILTEDAGKEGEP